MGLRAAILQHEPSIPDHPGVRILFVTPRQYLGTRYYHCSYQRGKNGPVGDDVSRPRGTVGRHHKPVSLTMGQDVRMGRMI
jgi:hypothetical protein